MSPEDGDRAIIALTILSARFMSESDALVVGQALDAQDAKFVQLMKANYPELMLKESQEFADAAVRCAKDIVQSWS